MDSRQEYFGQMEPHADPETLRRLIETTNPDAIVTDAPKQPFRLGFFSTVCLIVNRVIGTGIFNSPGIVIRGTNSTAGAMLLWFAGTLFGLAGVHVYVEYGLNVPRYVIDGIEQAVPRSGGDLHYLQYVYRWLYYKKDTVLLSGCLFGISFICLGNMAGNSIAFAVRVLQAANPGIQPSNGTVRGIALAVAAFACVIHAVSRRGGIWLSNFLACVKAGILLLVVVLAIRFGVLQGSDVINENFSNSISAPKIPGIASGEDCKAPLQVDAGASGYARAFLSIIFAFSGFDQANYVLGEVSKPRRTFPRAAFFAMTLISVLYMAVNICYMAVVTAYEQQAGAIGGCRTTDTVEDVALLFFKKALASDTHDDTPFRVFNALLALSSFGNIIVMTYTAARMKQEIAKQGFLPYPQFFGRNTDLSIGRLTEYLRSKAGMSLRFITPENHRDPTPVGALVLHLASCIVLIFATVGMTTSHEAYSLLTGLAAYLVTAFFGSFLALGILLLRIFGPPGQSSPSSPGEKKKTWSQMTAGTVNPYLSACCATIYLLLNLFPVIASWFNTLNSNTDVRPSWLIPGISGMVLALSAAWWIGFLGVAKYRLRRQQKEFRYEARPEFEMADGTDSEGPGEVGVPGKERMGDGGMILAHETVLIAWVGGEMEMLSTVAASRGQGVEMDGFGLKSPYPVSRTHEMHPRLRGYG